MRGCGGLHLDWEGKVQVQQIKLRKSKARIGEVRHSLARMLVVLVRKSFSGASEGTAQSHSGGFMLLLQLMLLAFFCQWYYGSCCGCGGCSGGAFGGDSCGGGVGHCIVVIVTVVTALDFAVKVLEVLLPAVAVFRLFL